MNNDKMSITEAAALTGYSRQSLYNRGIKGAAPVAIVRRMILQKYGANSPRFDGIAQAVQIYKTEQALQAARDAQKQWLKDVETVEVDNEN